MEASLFQVLFSVRFKRQLMQHVQYTMLFRWLVGWSLTTQSEFTLVA